MLAHTRGARRAAHARVHIYQNRGYRYEAQARRRALRERRPRASRPPRRAFGVGYLHVALLVLAPYKNVVLRYRHRPRLHSSRRGRSSFVENSSRRSRNIRVSRKRKRRFRAALRGVSHQPQPQQTARFRARRIRLFCGAALPRRVAQSRGAKDRLGVSRRTERAVRQRAGSIFRACAKPQKPSARGGLYSRYRRARRALRVRPRVAKVRLGNAATAQRQAVCRLARRVQVAQEKVRRLAGSQAQNSRNARFYGKRKVLQGVEFARFAHERNICRIQARASKSRLFRPRARGIKHTRRQSRRGDNGGVRLRVCRRIPRYKPVAGKNTFGFFVRNVFRGRRKAIHIRVQNVPPRLFHKQKKVLRRNKEQGYRLKRQFSKRRQYFERGERGVRKDHDRRFRRRGLHEREHDCGAGFAVERVGGVHRLRGRRVCARAENIFGGVRRGGGFRPLARVAC